MSNESPDQKSPQKKGRPTPKRKDAESARKVSSLAPARSKEEKARQKSAARVLRMAQREAYLRGDENALPMRDRGPLKKFVRNYVDSRRSIGEYFLPVIALVLIVSLFGPRPSVRWNWPRPSWRGCRPWTWFAWLARARRPP